MCHQEYKQEHLMWPVMQVNTQYGLVQFTPDGKIKLKYPSESAAVLRLKG